MSAPDSENPLEILPWNTEILPPVGWWDTDVAGIWRYRDLILLFIKRDFVTFYKQTVLGPIWYILQPLFTTGILTVVFGTIAKISTDGTPPFLFYMAGTVCWGYFSQTLTKTSNTFIQNAGVFGKVYFPRLTVPIAGVLVQVAQLALQLLLFLSVYLYYVSAGAALRPTFELIFLPLVVLQMVLLSLGVGIVVSSLTTKYRDLNFALGFGVQLWMYASPIMYPASIIPPQYLDLYMINPMAPIVESFRLMCFGSATIALRHVLLGWGTTVLILFVGVLMFSRIEKSFMDTV